MDWLRHHYIAVGGTVGILMLAALAVATGNKWIDARVKDGRAHYRYRKLLTTIVTVIVVVVVALLWGRLVPHHGTFFGLIGAGMAVALKEPLLSIAGRIAIFAGRIYNVGDRIQIGPISGDVIDIGFFYTQMMEIGNWIGGDQYSGRLFQMPNANIFGAGVFNYTRDFNYIWDEIHLNITYDSNLKAASEILLDAAKEYTHQFLEGAQQQLERMRQYFLVPEFELQPQVYLNVTTNWVGLTLRYVVEPKKRRSAATFLYRAVFERVQKSGDIQIGTDTMEVTYKKAEAEKRMEQSQPKRAA